MSATKAGVSRKRESELELTKSDNKKTNRSSTKNFDLDFDFDLSEFVFAAFDYFFIFVGIIIEVSDLMFLICSDLKGIVSALHLIRDKAQKDDQKKNEETISRYCICISISSETFFFTVV